MKICSVIKAEGMAIYFLFVHSVEAVKMRFGGSLIIERIFDNKMKYSDVVGNLHL